MTSTYRKQSQYPPNFAREMSAIVLMCSQLTSAGAFASDVELSVDSYYRHFLYREYATDDRKLNQEKGWLPGLGLTGSYAANDYFKLSLQADLSSGLVDYLGQTNFGVGLSTQTDERLVRYAAIADVDLSNWLKLSAPLWWQSQLGWNEWDRDIQPKGIVQGLYEEYQWAQVSTGLKWEFVSRVNWSLSAAAQVVYVLNPEIMVDLRPQGYPIVYLDLEEKPGWLASVAGVYHFSPTLNIAAAVDYESWEFGASELVVVSGKYANARVREPDSESRLLSVSLSLGKVF